MRKILGAIVLAGALVLGASVAPHFAAAESKSAEPVLKPDDVRKAREAIVALTQIFDDEPAAQSVLSRAQESQPPKKDMADVADRALSILSGYIGVAAAAVEKAAPEVWRVMIRQQYANAIFWPTIPAGLLLITLGYCAILKRIWPKIENPTTDAEKEDMNWRGGLSTAVPFIGGLVFSVWLVIAVGLSIKVFINPEYYAFRDLLQLLLSRGAL
ncbi:MAG: hypothetical protein HYS44_00260 [Candidatus Niyogibacteria bacterium]|nr:hypothetical protein [Candidatus Niyogibacteria bacterium]